MFLMQKNSRNLVEVLSMQKLFDPFSLEVTAQSHSGEELQDPETFLKSELLFPSGEQLPRCWVDPDYRDEHRNAPNATVVR
ncbi:MAG TPA: acetyltransferase [Leptolyngbyaceae cyanobacterium M33_DOE_097]|nr:acetyltransferase [Leptolyngbyaceae cyanobacterium M33_DOE_097]